MFCLHFSVAHVHVLYFQKIKIETFETKNTAMLLLTPPPTYIKGFYNWVSERLKLGPILDRFMGLQGHITITLRGSKTAQGKMNLGEWSFFRDSSLCSPPSTHLVILPSVRVTDLTQIRRGKLRNLLSKMKSVPLFSGSSD